MSPKNNDIIDGKHGWGEMIARHWKLEGSYCSRTVDSLEGNIREQRGSREDGGDPAADVADEGQDIVVLFIDGGWSLRDVLKRETATTTWMKEMHMNNKEGQRATRETIMTTTKTWKDPHNMTWMRHPCQDVSVTGVWGQLGHTHSQGHGGLTRRTPKCVRWSHRQTVLLAVDSVEFFLQPSLFQSPVPSSGDTETLQQSHLNTKLKCVIKQMKRLISF